MFRIMSTCVNCGNELEGKQTRFCCKQCKMEYYKKERRGTSYNSEYSQKKDAHGVYLKYRLILARGGKCECCGYNKNIASLQFHHIDPSTKSFTLDSRTLERKSDEAILEEFAKCKLLCSNCHCEVHHPEMIMENYQKFKELSQGIRRKKEHDLKQLDVGE